MEDGVVNAKNLKKIAQDKGLNTDSLVILAINGKRDALKRAVEQHNSSIEKAKISLDKLIAEEQSVADGTGVMAARVLGIENGIRKEQQVSPEGKTSEPKIDRDKLEKEVRAEARKTIEIAQAEKTKLEQRIVNAPDSLSLIEQFENSRAVDAFDVAMMVRLKAQIAAMQENAANNKKEEIKPKVTEERLAELARVAQESPNAKARRRARAKIKEINKAQVQQPAAAAPVQQAAVPAPVVQVPSPVVAPAMPIKQPGFLSRVWSIMSGERRALRTEVNKAIAKLEVAQARDDAAFEELKGMAAQAQQPAQGEQNSQLPRNDTANVPPTSVTPVAGNGTDGVGGVNGNGTGANGVGAVMNTRGGKALSIMPLPILLIMQMSTFGATLNGIAASGVTMPAAIRTIASRAYENTSAIIVIVVVGIVVGIVIYRALSRRGHDTEDSRGSRGVTSEGTRNDTGLPATAGNNVTGPAGRKSSGNGGSASANIKVTKPSLFARLIVWLNVFSSKNPAENHKARAPPAKAARQLKDISQFRTANRFARRTESGQAYLGLPLIAIKIYRLLTSRNPTVAGKIAANNKGASWMPKYLRATDPIHCGTLINKIIGGVKWLNLTIQNSPSIIWSSSRKITPYLQQLVTMSISFVSSLFTKIRATSTRAMGALIAGKSSQVTMPGSSVAESANAAQSLLTGLTALINRVRGAVSSPTAQVLIIAGLIAAAIILRKPTAGTLAMAPVVFGSVIVKEDETARRESLRATAQKVKNWMNAKGGFAELFCMGTAICIAAVIEGAEARYNETTGCSFVVTKDGYLIEAYLEGIGGLLGNVQQEFQKQYNTTRQLRRGEVVILKINENVEDIYQKRNGWQFFTAYGQGWVKVIKVMLGVDIDNNPELSLNDICKFQEAAKEQIKKECLGVTEEATAKSDPEFILKLQRVVDFLAKSDVLPQD
ncbi:MAG: hypothetical protein WC513_09460, partial [Bacteroidales bacterium]